MVAALFDHIFAGLFLNYSVSLIYGGYLFANQFPYCLNYIKS